MADVRRLSPRDLEVLLKRVKDSHGSASLRMEGTARMLGQLQVCGLEQGTAIRLGGAKQRDRVPPAGTPVTLSVLLDEEVVSMDTVLLEPLDEAETGRQRPRVLRAAWPTRPLEFHHRDEVRVAAPELPALDATLSFQDRRYPAQLLNLTETGMGLGLEHLLPSPLHGEVVVETQLPGGLPLRLVAEVRHWEFLEHDPLPVRIGLVLKDLPAGDRESLRRMIQARRILRSESIRDE
jgi:c-di-GMP-binding flagellar brake protein YcgR